MSCGESGLAGELVECALVVACGGAQGAGCGWVGIGELGQAGLKQSGVQVGDQHGVVQPGVADPVAVGLGDACDQAVGTQPAQVVADLAGADVVGVFCRAGRRAVHAGRG